MIGFYFISMAASRRLTARLNHNFLPLFTMRLNFVTINSIRDKVSGFVTGSVVDEIVTVIVKKSVVECESVVSWHNVTSATAFQPEADDWEGERNAVDILGFGVDIFDSFDCFGLKFCHAFTIAPCTVSSREKCEKVCQAKKYNSSGDLDLARQLLHPPPLPPPRGGGGGGEGDCTMPLGGRQAE